MSTLHGYRAQLLHFPVITSAPDKDCQHYRDGLLVTRNGKIEAIGDANQLLPKYPDLTVSHFPDGLLVPGFIDAHVHFPQTEMIASYGEQLLEWLQNYTFPTELKFADPDYSSAIADVFLRQLFRHGTTSALVYATVHKVATDALFQAAQAKNMLLVGGKVCMDRNSPEALQDTAASAQRDSAALIEQWHGNDRLYYALTPRFAPTSSEAQLAALGELAQSFPDVFIQTHLSENPNEIQWVKSLFPQHQHYLDVYDHYHMVRPRAVFGHCLHLAQSEWQRLSDSGATIAFCPTSNLFLGSGLFNLDKARDMGVHVALATDVGAGTSFSMLKTAGEAYKVCQLQHQRLCPLQGLYDMTMGSAAGLGLNDKIGNLNPGTDADFVILEPRYDELLAMRICTDAAPTDMLFALSMLGDDRAIRGTWIAGQNVYQKQGIEE
ncbi:guanine deaminase [Aestuariibacter halophilus]|uniref:Guanine deaminase n=1 Tax=Fluctibacter halophilus TaxID=226011 RepID=A0ABS8G5G6_9ALTE|nr:guanine deaminase [Aestuariibacter halophilus]MCC2615739.1 guanine deaminase [Aestuariibacter halophilus]